MMVAIEKERCRQFECWLRPEIRTPFTVTTMWCDYAKLVDATPPVEQSLKGKRLSLMVSREEEKESTEQFSKKAKSSFSHELHWTGDQRPKMRGMWENTPRNCRQCFNWRKIGYYITTRKWNYYDAQKHISIDKVEKRSLRQCCKVYVGSDPSSQCSDEDVDIVWHFHDAMHLNIEKVFS